MASQNKQFYILSAQLHSSFTTMCVLILFFSIFGVVLKFNKLCATLLHTDSAL